MEKMPDFDVDYSYVLANFSELYNMSYPHFPFRGDVDRMTPDRIIAIILCIIAILVNAISLFAIIQFKGAFTANKQLVTSLLASDLFISVCFLIASVTNSNNIYAQAGDDVGETTCIYAVVEALMISGQLTNLLNLSAMALDHYIAINIPLKHSYLMDRRHVGILIGGVWVLGSVCGFSDFLFPFAPFYSYCQNHNFVNYCDKVKCTMFEPNFLLFAVVILCFIEMAFFYSRVFRTVYQYPRLQSRHTQNTQRNNKGLVTTIIIVVSYTICWLPYCLMELTMTIMSLTNTTLIITYYKVMQEAQYYLYNLIALNSIFDPLIYAIRMPDMQNSYRRLLRMCKKHKPSMHHISMMDRKSTTSGTVFVDNVTETGV